MRKLIIDISKEYPPLANPPVIESVISWTFCESEERSVTVETKEAVATLLPDYRDIQFLHEHSFSVNGDLAERREPVSIVGLVVSQEPENAWRRCRFLNNGVHLHQLAPYKNWRDFSAEAKRFLLAYETIFGPQSVKSIGTRFISLIEGVKADEVHNYLREMDLRHPFSNLDCSGFVLRQEYELNEGAGYKVRVSKSIGQLVNAQGPLSGLIVDIAVVTKNPVVDLQMQDVIIKELRAIKNEVFFALFKPESFGA